MGARLVVRAAFFMSPSPKKMKLRDCANGSSGIPFRSESTKMHKETGTHERRPLAHLLPGVPALRSCEIAVTNCAGANGFSRRMLLGTPREGQRPAAAPVM